MATYALVKDGKIINRVEWDGASAFSYPGATLMQVDEARAEIGDDVIGGAVVAKPEPVRPPEPPSKTLIEQIIASPDFSTLKAELLK